MSVIVTDAGFQAAEQTQFAPLAAIADHQGAVDLAHTDDPEALLPYLGQIKLIRIGFPAFNDGRGFTIAHRLRALGFTGRLRAFGPVIADQYAMARRVGFDEVEIPDELAARQPEAQWKFRANWQDNDYQSRLRA